MARHERGCSPARGCSGKQRQRVSGSMSTRAWQRALTRKKEKARRKARVSWMGLPEYMKGTNP
eukprot:469337-Rhodomonas_salina.2